MTPYKVAPNSRNLPVDDVYLGLGVEESVLHTQQRGGVRLARLAVAYSLG